MEMEYKGILLKGTTTEIGELIQQLEKKPVTKEIPQQTPVLRINKKRIVYRKQKHRMFIPEEIAFIQDAKNRLSAREVAKRLKCKPAAVWYQWNRERLLDLKKKNLLVVSPTAHIGPVQS